MSKVPYINLNDGNEIPQLGLGTWRSSKGEVRNAVYVAIKVGYRHIDCAYIYGNEDEVGEGINQAINEKLVERKDLFITSKCWLTFLRKDRVKLCLEKTLKRLNLTYLDLYLIHWPMAFKQNDEEPFPKTNDLMDFDESINICETWSAFEELKKSNLVRSIGVSNFTIDQLKRVLNSCKIKPVVNQVECHPYLNQDVLIDFCAKNNIYITSYCPLGSTPLQGVDSNTLRLFDDKKIQELSKKYKKTVAQILIRYHIDKGLIVIPKSVNEDRIRQNFDVFDFKLDKSDVELLVSLNIPQRYCTFDINGVPKHKEYPFK